MTDIEIRRKILEMLYEKFKEHPYYRITPKEFTDALNIGLKELSYNIIYLEEKGCLELQKPLEGSIFVGARITIKGIDLVEDRYQFDLIFPISKSETSTQNDAFKEFNFLIDKIKSSDKIKNDLKEIVIEEINALQRELKKNKPSYSRVKEFLNKIKDRDSYISEQVLEILKDPVITKILSESAKSDLDTQGSGLNI